jgi:hypothetical protein
MAGDGFRPMQTICGAGVVINDDPAYAWFRLHINPFLRLYGRLNCFVRLTGL